MRKIIRLTESDLARIVRRVIREDATAVVDNGTKAFQLIKNGLDTAYEDKVQNGVFTIKNKTDYDTCLALVKKERSLSKEYSIGVLFRGNDPNYDTIIEYISADMDNNNDMLNKFEKYLKQFNSEEKV